MAIIKTLCCISVFASPVSEEILSRLNVPDNGTTTWTIVVTTPHLGSDPVFSSAAKLLALDTLSSLVSTNDKIDFYWAEHSVWHEIRGLSWADLDSNWPVNHQRNSLGGFDLERVASQIAPKVDGHLLFFSAGPSQQAQGGTLRLYGGTGEISGFDGPYKTTIPVPESGSRDLLITYYKKPNAFIGDAPREFVELTQSEGSKKQMTKAAPKYQESNLGLWRILPWFLIPIAGVSGFYFARRFVTRETPPNPSDDFELETWKTESTKLTRKIDHLTQDLAEAISSLEVSDDHAQLELRQEIARLDREISSWNQVAIEFLDSAYRAEIFHATDPKLQNEVANLRKRFYKLSERLGFSVIDPQPGEAVIPGFQKLVGVKTTTNQEDHGLIVCTIVPGYRKGQEVLKQAEVEIWEYEK